MVLSRIILIVYLRKLIKFLKTPTQRKNGIVEEE